MVGSARVVHCAGGDRRSGVRVRRVVVHAAAAGRSPRRFARSHKPGGVDPDLGRAVAGNAGAVRERQEIPGASAAVVIPGMGVWAGSAGEADTGSHRPVTDRTLFAIGSITKTFVAALMLKLAEDQRARSR